MRNYSYDLKKNESYFDVIDTDEKAYFLGLIYADGSVSQHNRLIIRLKTEDKQILSMLSQIIFGKEHLYHQGPRRFFCMGMEFNSSGHYALYVTSRRLVSRLSELGVYPRKSLTLRFPSKDQVPDRLMGAFLRGFNDGDGCINHYSQGVTTRFRISIIAPKEFCEKMSQKTKELIGVDMRISPRKKMHMAIVSGNRRVKRMLDFMYRDETACLSRKKDKYLKLCEYLSGKEMGHAPASLQKDVQPQEPALAPPDFYQGQARPQD